MFATIEDFMWFMASVVRSAPAAPAAGGSGFRSNTPGKLSLLGFIGSSQTYTLLHMIEHSLWPSVAVQFRILHLFIIG